METSPLPRPEEGPFQIRRKKTPPDEDAGLQGGASGSEGGGKHVEKAVLELTKIAKSLTASRRDSKPDLEALLGYGLLGDRSEACSSGSSRRNSAALAALRRAVRESPALIYEPMERNLREAVQGEPQGQATARSRLQTHSRVQNFTNHVRWMWQLAAMWDWDRVPEARARVALLMAAGEHSSIDGGN